MKKLRPRELKEIVGVPWVLSGRVEILTQVCMTAQTVLFPIFYTDTLRAGVGNNFYPFQRLLNNC